MAEKGFGVKEVNLIGASGTPTITSPNNLNLNAVNVAISTNASIGGNLTVSGTVGIAGTLTYEDVTNVDSVGLITARNGINVSGGNVTIAKDIDVDGHTNLDNVNIAGVTTFGNNINASGTSRFEIASMENGVLDGEISHNGDATTKIKFPSNNNISFDTSGTTRLNINNSGATVTGTLSATTFSGSGVSLTGVAVTEAPVTDYTITANGSSAYRFHGGGVDETEDNPDLYLIRGQKYRFNNTTGSSHPFEIRISNDGSAYSNGVTGDDEGVQFFTVPYDAPAKIFYQCTVHSGMVGNLYIRGANGNNDNVGISTFSNVVVAESIAVNRPRIVLSAPDEGSSYRHLFGANLKVDSSGTFTTPTANISGGGWQYLAANSLNAHGHMTYMSAPDTNATSSTTLERLRIDAAGRVLIGHATTPNNVASVAVVGSFGSSSNLTPFIYLCRDETVGNVTSNESLGQILFASSDGYRGAVIEGSAAGAWSSSSSDGYLTIKTTPDNSTVPTEKLRITSSGNVNIGGNYTQTDYTAQMMTGANKFISFTSSAHNDFSDEASAIIFSRVSDGAKELSGIFQHSTTSFGIATRGNLTLHAGGSGGYHSSPERVRILNDGKVLIGHTSNIFNYKLAVFGTDGGHSGIAASRFSNNTSPSSLILSKSRSASIGNFTVLQNNDEVGMIDFRGADGTDNNSKVAEIKACVDGTPGSNDMPGRLQFHTTADGASTTTERLRITSDGDVNVLTGQMSVTTPEYLRVGHTNSSHNQGLADNATHWIQFGAEYDDTKNGWSTGSNNYYTIQKTGYFLVTAQAVITTTTANTLRDWALGVEQSTDSGNSYSLIQNAGGRGGGSASTDTDTATPVVTFVLNFTAGTRIRVRAHANTNGSTWLIDEDLGDAQGGSDYGGSGFDNQKGTRLHIIRLF